MEVANDKIVVELETKGFDKAKNSSRELNSGLLQAGLGFLFTGMAIKRFFEGILTSMFSLFLDVEGQGGAVNNAVGDLMASLAYLKYSFIEAFVESGALQNWIDRIQSLIDLFNQLSPATKSAAVDFAVWTVGISAATMVLGQLSLSILAIRSALMLMGITFGGTFGAIFSTLLVVAAAFVYLSSKLHGIGNVFTWLGLTALLALAFIGDAIISALYVPLSLVVGIINAVIWASNKLFGTTWKKIDMPALGAMSLTNKVMQMREAFVAQAEGVNQQAAQNFTPVPNYTPAYTQNVTFNVEGNVSKETADEMLRKLQEAQYMSIGSPQSS